MPENTEESNASKSPETSYVACASSGYADIIEIEEKYWMKSCDQCRFQEGGHYCVYHSMQFKNMDLMTCKRFEIPDEEKNLRKSDPHNAKSEPPAHKTKENK
jgi:hypothetical protein